MATLDDLLKDWHDRADKDPMKYMYYVERMKELVEYIADPRFAIVPYRRSNGHMDYRLKVIGDGGRTRREGWEGQSNN